MRPFGHVAQITPYPVGHHGEDMPIGRQATLSLPQIKFERIDGVILRGAA
jgi:hypothetical protein